MPKDTQPIIQLRAADVTDVGMVRDHNEDTGYVDPGLGFFIVADGMGGHAAGEVASAMAVEEVSKALDAARAKLDAFATAPNDEDRRDVVAVLENAVRAAHQAVFSRGVKETDKQGMGTTLDVLLVTGAEAFIAHVGDSRTYLLRDGKAAQITTDHTVAEVLVIEGKLSMEEAQASPLRTILVNAIGVSADVGVEISHVRLRKGDRMLLCSDGLHDYFPADEEIADHLIDGEIITGLTEMVDIAKQRGGHDNITGIVVEVLEVEAPEEEDAEGEEFQSERSVSDGVPREIGTVDTMPVDVEESGHAEQARKKAKTKKKSRGSRSTLPLGVEAVDGEAPPEQKAAAERKTTPMTAETAEEEAAIRRTEPMPTVADPTADTVDANADDDD